MIVRDRPSGLKLFLLLRGSVLQQIWKVLLINVLLATLVTFTHGVLFSQKITLTAIPFTLIGLPLAIFLGFRNTAAYDRYWEARKLWGELLLRCRNLSRQCQSLIDLPHPVPPGAGLDDVRVRMVHRAIAFCHALRQQLRGVPDRGEVQALLQPPEWQALQRSGSPTTLLMHHMGLDLQHCLRSGYIGEPISNKAKARLTAILTRHDLTLGPQPLKEVAAHANFWLNASDEARLVEMGKAQGMSVGETITALDVDEVAPPMPSICLP